ncbi:hypothetical protein DY000_02044472 [Brassica cretica]|uniref:Uncharacterized protein n=1 Tax=Brassica cretica TaxID=69181 RepID=A0ABQ7ETJ2_BRACR|nr:hypothetical protein DY000_02044472 [Brassica cretica]
MPNEMQFCNDNGSQWWYAIMKYTMNIAWVKIVVVNLLTLVRRGSACEYELPSKLTESPSNSESARSLDEPMTSDEFERKMTMAPRWMEEQFTAESVA